LALDVHRRSIMFEGLAANYERYMTLLSERQKLVASNIANVDTPGYRTQDIDFRSEFENASAGEAPTVVEPSNLTVKSDGNNVDLDREARLLAENALRFQIATNFARGELSDVKMALQDGK
jgi:flagellar basal-body rod protein FlgB